MRFKKGSGEGAAAPAPANQSEWRRINLYSYPDYQDIRIGQIQPLTGAWPPPAQGVLIERASLPWMGVQEGDLITVETTSGKATTVARSRTVHDVGEMSAGWLGRAAGYISADTSEWLGESRDFNELNIIVAQNKPDKEYVTEVAKQVRDKVERGGEACGTLRSAAGKHPADEVVQPILLLMGRWVHCPSS